MLAQDLEQVFLVVRHPDVDPSRMKLRRPRRVEKLGVRLRIKVECAVRVSFAKVEAEIAALGVACLPIEEIEVSLVVEVAEAVLDVLVA